MSKPTLKFRIVYIREGGNDRSVFNNTPIIVGVKLKPLNTESEGFEGHFNKILHSLIQMIKL